MQKKVLLISQYFLPDINAASFRINDLYKALKKQNFDVSVVTAYPQKSAVDKVRNTEDIHRIKLEKVNKKSFINYLRNYFGFMFKSIFYSVFRLNKKKYDYVIVTSPPLFVALGGLVISKIKRTKLVIDIRDIWPDSAVSAGMVKYNGLLYKITKKIERFIYKRADIITCVSNPMRNYIYKESKNENINVLYNGISPESIEGNYKTVVNSTVKKEKIRVGYAGNIGIVQNLDVILEASQILEKNEQDKDFEFIIIGDGIERVSLKQKLNKLGISNITFKGTMSKSDTINELNSMNLLFLSLIDDPVLEKTIPSKLFDYLLNNKPIITSIKGEGKDILSDLKCGIYFESNDPNSLVAGLSNYRKSQKYYDTKALNNRKYVTKYYNREEIFKKFIQKL